MNSPKRILAACLCLCCACGGASQTDTNRAIEQATSQATTQTPAFAPSEVYAVLFEEGRSWTYQATSVSAYWDDEDPRSPSRITPRTPAVSF